METDQGELLKVISALFEKHRIPYWILKNEAFDQSRFKRRKKIQLLGEKMAIASMEDTILQKLRWFKQAQIEKHLVDAAFVYQMQKNKLNLRYLKKWAKILEVEKYIKELKKIDLEKYL